MYLRTTLAAQTLASTNNIWGTCNELSSVLNGIASYLASGGDKANNFYQGYYGEKERKEHLVGCVCSLEEQVQRLSQLYPVKNLHSIFQRTLDEIQEIHRLLSEFELAEIVSTPENSQDALQSRVAELSISRLISSVSEHIQSTTPLSDQQTKLITPELVKQNSQAAVQQMFVLFEDCLRNRIGAGPELYGENLINKAFGKERGVLAYGETPAEQQGVRNLISGAYATFRNPRMHRLIKDDEETVLAIIALIDLLNKIVDEAKLSS